MRIDVYFTPLGPKEGDFTGRGVIVIDVLRATTTIATALANGAKAVVPAATSEEAVRLTANLEKNGYLLAGERKALRIDGFQLGNSPREMTPAAVSGKTIYLATTNGTPALVAAQGAELVLIGAAVNFKATAERARKHFQDRGEVAIICAGRERQFALEDAYTAGRLVKALKKGVKKVVLNDAAEVALALTNLYDDWADAFKGTAAAQQLADADLKEDVAFAAKQDRFDKVPVYAERRIT
jgi:2-phosphosulfolactate phosphatase